MTIRDLMDRFEVPAGARYTVGMMLAMKGISLDDTLGVQFDRDTECLRIAVAGTTILDTTLAAIEAGLGDDGSGPQVDGGGPAGGPGLAG